MEEIFERTAMLIGEEGLRQLSASKVVVLGIGGVGSFTAEALARSGVGHLILCDFDHIVASNLNRQIHATQNTIGELKVQVMADRLKSINPSIEVTVIKDKYTAETAEMIVPKDTTYVVDAIDMVTSKLHLVEYCQARHIPLIASMGTGNKLNPMMFEVTDIYKTSVCPLAKVMRKELKKRGVKKLKVLYSKEVPIKPVTKESEASEPAPSFSRRGTPGSIAFVPSVAGLIIASEVVKDLLELGN